MRISYAKKRLHKARTPPTLAQLVLTCNAASALAKTGVRNIGKRRKLRALEGHADEGEIIVNSSKGAELLGAVMIRRLPVFVLVCAAPVVARGQEQDKSSTRLFMPDGQLFSHLVRVFVNQDIPEGAEPTLYLFVPHSWTEEMKGERDPQHPIQISRDHYWIQKEGDREVILHGTLLLFDLRKYSTPFFKAILRVTPVLSWKIKGETKKAIGPKEVYLGNIKVAALWTAIVLASLVVLVGWMSKRTGETAGPPRKGNWLGSITDIDGSLSLWRAQLAGWTLAVGSVVLCFALMRLEVPEIPESLVVLMGFSLVTSGISGWKESKSESRGSETTETRNESPTTSGTFGVSSYSTKKLPMLLSDFVTYVDERSQEKEVSIAKVQMVFWTVLTLIIFISKSLIDGTLWPVPWQLVALMGMSQAGYVIPKVAPEYPFDTGSSARAKAKSDA